MFSLALGPVGSFFFSFLLSLLYAPLLASCVDPLTAIRVDVFGCVVCGIEIRLLSVSVPLQE